MEPKRSKQTISNPFFKALHVFFFFVFFFFNLHNFKSNGCFLSEAMDAKDRTGERGVAGCFGMGWWWKDVKRLKPIEVYRYTHESRYTILYMYMKDCRSFLNDYLWFDDLHLHMVPSFLENPCIKSMEPRYHHISSIFVYTSHMLRICHASPSSGWSQLVPVKLIYSCDCCLLNSASSPKNQRRTMGYIGWKLALIIKELFFSLVGIPFFNR